MCDFLLSSLLSHSPMDHVTSSSSRSIRFLNLNCGRRWMLEDWSVARSTKSLSYISTFRTTITWREAGPSSYEPNVKILLNLIVVSSLRSRYWLTCSLLVLVFVLSVSSTDERLQRDHDRTPTLISSTSAPSLLNSVCYECPDQVLDVNSWSKLLCKALPSLDLFILHL